MIIKTIIFIFFLIFSPVISFSQNTNQQSVRTESFYFFSKEMRQYYGIETELKRDRIVFFDYGARNRFDVIKSLSFTLDTLEYYDVKELEGRELLYLAEIKDGSYFLKVEIPFTKEWINQFFESSYKRREEMLKFIISAYL